MRASPLGSITTAAKPGLDRPGRKPCLGNRLTRAGGAHDQCVLAAVARAERDRDRLARLGTSNRHALPAQCCRRRQCGEARPKLLCESAQRIERAAPPRAISARSPPAIRSSRASAVHAWRHTRRRRQASWPTRRTWWGRAQPAQAPARPTSNAGDVRASHERRSGRRAGRSLRAGLSRKASRPVRPEVQRIDRWFVGVSGRRHEPLLSVDRLSPAVVVNEKRRDRWARR